MPYWLPFYRTDKNIVARIDALSRETDDSGYVGPFDVWAVTKRVNAAGDAVTDDGVRFTDCWFDGERMLWFMDCNTVEVLVEGGRRFVTHYARPISPSDEEGK